MPILLYCSEIWGIYDKNDFNNWEKDPIEKTQAYFCKLALGVNKRSPNAGSKNELGRVSTKQIIDMNIIKFWSYLENKPEESIAYQCLLLSKNLTSYNKHGLLGKINSIIEKYDLNHSHILNNKHNIKALLPDINSKIRKKLDEHQMMLINANRKLAFYSSLRKDTKPAIGIDQIKNAEHKRSLIKLKLGNHNLRIETGRYTIPKTLEQHRICIYCDNNEIEHESHFILKCTLYGKERNDLFQKIKKKYSNFQSLSEEHKLLFLFNSISQHLSNR